MESGPIILSIKLAVVTTTILLILAIPLAHWITYSKSRWRPIVQTLVAMPLVLPPTVLGFYLLVLFSPSAVLGHFLDETIGVRLVFSFGGLVIASLIYSLPFMVQPIQSGLQNLPTSLREASLAMGKSKLTTLRRVLLPSIRSSLLTGVVLSFAGIIGEFGVVLMIGGNIPDKTRVASIAIYDEVEALNFAAANEYALVLIAITFTILLLLYYLNGNFLKDLMR